MYEPRVCAEIANIRNRGVMRPGIWYAVTDNGQWIDMAGARLICAPALYGSDKITFDLAAARAAGGAELAEFARRHGVTFYDVLDS